MRKQFIYHKNRVFMLVEPRPWMMSSTLIKEALRTGGNLAVEMNTGYLTVIRNFELRTPDGKPLDIFKLVNLETGASYDLPWDPEVATIKILDYIGESKDQFVVKYWKYGEEPREQLLALSSFNWFGMSSMTKTIKELTGG
jgi:hypothetical protein